MRGFILCMLSILTVTLTSCGGAWVEGEKVVEIKVDKKTDTETYRIGEPFEIRGFEITLLGAKKFTEIGRPSNLQRSNNGEFIMFEYTSKNIGEGEWYSPQFEYLISGDTQYEDSSTASVYWETQMGYATEESKIFEWVVGKYYQGFDVADLEEGAYLVMYNFSQDFSVKIPVSVFLK